MKPSPKITSTSPMIPSAFFTVISLGFISLDGFAQADTILINNEQIVCSVKQVTADAVQFTYPGEDVLNTVYKNTVQKIVFSNGRVQTFFESSSLKPVTHVEDFENVTITAIESEVKGLFKLGEVSAKAKGTTTLANQERVKERAYQKMKIEAAMMGANIVYLTDQRSQGNTYGGYYQSGSSTETSVTGVAYTNQRPNYEIFIKLINSEKYFPIVEEYKMWSGAAHVKKTPVEKELTIKQITNENGVIIIEGDLEGNRTHHRFKVTHFNNDYFLIYHDDKRAAYSYKLIF